MKILRCEHCSNFFSEPENKVGRPRRFCSDGCGGRSWHKREGSSRRKIKRNTDPRERERINGYQKSYWTRVIAPQIMQMVTWLSNEFRRRDASGRAQFAVEILNYPTNKEGYYLVTKARERAELDYWLADYLEEQHAV